MRAASVTTGAALAGLDPGGELAAQPPEQVAVEVERGGVAQRRARRLERGRRRPRARAAATAAARLGPAEQRDGAARDVVGEPRRHLAPRPSRGAAGGGAARARRRAAETPTRPQLRAVEQARHAPGHAALGAHEAAQPARRDVGLGGLARALERGLEAGRVGQRGRVAAGDVDGAADRRLGPGDEEAAGEGGGVGAEAPQHRVAVAHARGRAPATRWSSASARGRERTWASTSEPKRPPPMSTSATAASSPSHGRTSRCGSNAPGRERDGAERGVAQGE